MDELVALCRRRGFVFQSSEIYGGLQGVYDYGPLGVELKNNLKKAWWKTVVYERDDVEGLDTALLTHPLTLRHSGHEQTFTDPMVDCRECQGRMRADHLKEGVCEHCGSANLTPPRPFNLMLRANFGPVETGKNFVYLRPETAQGIFINFKNVRDTTSQKLPFGIAQIGKAFRNEVTPKNFIFRVREFEQMELEFFVKPGEDELWHQRWVDMRFQWWQDQGLGRENLCLQEQKPEELAHYAKATVDILYRFPHGFEELEGIANRTDFDLGSHSKEQQELCLKASVLENKASNTKLVYQDHATPPLVPFVIEPSAGLDRGVLAVLWEALSHETLESGQTRTVLKLKPHLSPIKVAVMPLARNNGAIVETAQTISRLLRQHTQGRVKYEDTGNIGKAYRRHDEIGTPFCVTIDFETLEGDLQSVTVRDRDSTKQERVAVAQLSAYLAQREA